MVGAIGLDLDLVTGYSLEGIDGYRTHLFVEEIFFGYGFSSWLSEMCFVKQPGCDF